jgi:hypothetical protein
MIGLFGLFGRKPRAERSGGCCGGSEIRRERETETSEVKRPEALPADAGKARLPRGLPFATGPPPQMGRYRQAAVSPARLTGNQ